MRTMISYYSRFLVLLLASAGLLQSCQSIVSKSQVTLDIPTEKTTLAQEATTPIILEDAPLFVSHDQGKSWKSAGEGLPKDAKIVHIEKSNNQFLLATFKQGLFLGNEKDWQAIGTTLPKAQFNAMHVKGDNFYVGLYEKGIYRSQDRGKSWHSLNYNLPDLRVQAILEFDDRLIVGTDIGIFEYYEDTHYWGKLFGEAQINSLQREGNKLVAATHKGILLSSDLGKIWRWIHEEGAASKCLLLNGQIAELNMSGHYYFSNDWGASWLTSLRMPLPRGANFDLVQDGDLLIMSNRFGIFHSYDGGISWEMALEIKDNIIQELFMDGKTLYAGNWSMGNC